MQYMCAGFHEVTRVFMICCSPLIVIKLIRWGETFVETECETIGGARKSAWNNDPRFVEPKEKARFRCQGEIGNRIGNR